VCLPKQGEHIGSPLQKPSHSCKSMLLYDAAEYNSKIVDDPIFGLGLYLDGIDYFEGATNQEIRYIPGTDILTDHETLELLQNKGVG